MSGNFSRVLKHGLLISAWIALSGCVGHGWHIPHRGRGVALSEAMESSASGGGQELHGSGGGGSETHTGAYVDPYAGSSGGGGLVSYGEEEYHWQVSLDTAYSIPFRGDIQSLTRFTLTPFTVEDEYNYVGVFVGGSIVELKSGSLPDRAVKNPRFFETGIVYRRYLARPNAVINPYFTANGAYQVLDWDYRNAISVNGDTVRSDGLEAGGGYAGFGLVFWRNRQVSCYGEAGAGGTVFFNQTLEGFGNDVFQDFGYFSVKVGVSFKF